MLVSGVTFWRRWSIACCSFLFALGLQLLDIQSVEVDRINHQRLETCIAPDLMSAESAKKACYEVLEPFLGTLP